MNIHYLSLIEKEYEYKKNKILEWESDIEHNEPEVFHFYKKILKYTLHKLQHKQNSILNDISCQMFTFLKNVVSFKSTLDFIYEFQLFLDNYFDEDIYRFEIKYYRNCGFRKIKSCPTHLYAYPIIYRSDDYNKQDTQYIQILEHALKQIIKYKKHIYKQILNHEKLFIKES